MGESKQEILANKLFVVGFERRRVQEARDSGYVVVRE
jgi:hypothetical protein